MIGRQLAHYEVLRKLGQGGMGEVYLARDTILERQVALKCPPPELQNSAEARHRFLREARAAAAIDHPYICQIHEVVSEADRLYIALEYIEGRTLKERLDEGRMEASEAVRLGLEIAEALEHAHRKGIVHRDLKPSNIMLTESGHAKVMDFGLAQWMPEARDEELDAETLTALTVEGVAVGTPAYMSPEQIRGHKVDHRSDIFSFGLVLYEMVTGTHPFRRDTAADTTVALAADPAPPVSSFRAGVPVILEHTIQKMLAKSPEQRYQSVHEVHTNLLALDSERPPLEAAGRLGDRLRRQPWLVVSLAAVALLSLAAILRWAPWSEPTAPTAPAPAARSVAPEWTVEIDPRSVAVLPFDNLTGDPAHGYYADGFGAGLTTRLAGIDGLRVTARSAIVGYGDSQQDLAMIAEEQRVAAVLTGAVEQRARPLRIRMELTDPRAGRRLWSKTYAESEDEVFAIASDAVRQVAAALGAELGEGETTRIDKAPTASLTAYHAYLKGREQYMRYGREENEEAIRLFRRALEIDPDYALARAGLADAYAQRVHKHGFDELWLESSIEVAKEALASDPDLAEAYKSLGLAYGARGRFSAAIEATARAVEINPNYYPALANLGFLTLVTGSAEEAMGWFRKTLAVAPLQPGSYAGSGFAYLFLDDYQRSERWFHRALELQPGFIDPKVGLISLYLAYGEYDKARRLSRAMLEDDPGATALAGDVELYAGRLSEALGLYERASSSAPIDSNLLLVCRPRLTTLLGYIRWKTGDRGEARALLNRSVTAARGALAAGWEFPAFSYDLAAAAALTGRHEEAKGHLRDAIEAGFLFYRGALTDPLLAELRDDAEFERIVADLRTEVSAQRQRVLTMTSE